MNKAGDDYSTQKITPTLITQIVDVLRNKAYGSVEIYVENYTVVQITQRTITKLKNSLSKNKTFKKEKISIGSGYSQQSVVDAK